MTRAAMQLALEALECTAEADDPGHRCGHCDDYVDRNGVVRAALRAALAQPDEVPEGCTPADAAVLRQANHMLAAELHEAKAALAQPAPVAQPLTDERIDTISDEVFDLIDGIPDDLVGSRTWDRMFARAIERAHKIGGPL